MTRILLFAFATSVLLINGTAQVPPPPPPPTAANAVVQEGPNKTDEQITAEVIELSKKPIDWKLRSFPRFAISVDTPRETIRQTETFFEQGIGKLSVEMQMSIGQDSVFIVGRLELPYSITDEKVLRELYQSLSSGMAEGGGKQFQHIRDLRVSGNLGVELRSLPDDIRYQSARGRAFVIGRDVYILLAMPVENEEEHEPPDKVLIDARSADFERFFDSLKVHPQSPPPVEAEPPLFRSTLVDGIYSSTHFKFSFSPPKGWIRVTETDAEDLRSWGRRVINDETGRNISVSAGRRNLVSFVSGPLGREGLAMISFTLGVPYRSFADVQRLGDETEKLLKGLSNYRIVKRPFETTLGTGRAIRMENIVTVAGMEQTQHIYYFPRISHVLGVSIACVEKTDCESALRSLGTIRFSDQ